MIRPVLSVLMLLASYPLAASTLSTFQLDSKDAAGEAVSARIVFTVDQSAGTLTVQLLNQLSNQISVGQAITGLSFGLTQGGAKLTGGQGELLNVSSKGTVTELGVGSLSAWHASTSLDTVTLTNLGAGKPKQAILGASTEGIYSSANGSIAGNKAHNSFVGEAATFTFTGLTGDITADSVRVGFGTAGNNYISAAAVRGAEPSEATFKTLSSSQITATPEPGAWTLMLVGGGLIVLSARRKLRR